jgi:hypothetical protein
MGAQANATRQSIKAKATHPGNAIIAFPDVFVAQFARLRLSQYSCGVSMRVHSLVS